jgi:hypothetical protein
MKTEDILLVEESADNRINLVRDRLFWQAWNRSAFLFHTYIKKYQVHKRFVQKVSQEVAWLGFPKIALAEIEKIAKSNNWHFEQKTSDHIVIDGLPMTNGYEKWWTGIVAKKAPEIEPIEPKKRKGNNLFPAYRVAYDLCLHIHRATEKISKEYRYELGARIKNYSIEAMEILHLANTVKSDVNEYIGNCSKVIHKLRICLRVLKDLCQISVKQWGFLNMQIDNLLNLLRAEFCNINIRIAKASHAQSSNPLPPAKQESIIFQEKFS